MSEKMHIYVTDRKIPIHKWYYENLMKLKKAVSLKWDGVILIDGPEGCGKTVKGCETCYVLGYNEKTGKSSFNIDCFCWTPEQFEKLVQKAKPGTAILWDEFVLGGLSTEAMSKMQNTIIKYFTTIRKKQLYIVMIIPYIYMLRMYFAVARTRALVHVYTPDGISRGPFKLYNQEQKRKLYFEGKKHWGYSPRNKHAFIGRTYVKDLKTFGIDEDEYDKRKDAAIKGIFEKADTKTNLFKNRFYKIIEYVKKEKGFKWQEMTDQLQLGMSNQAIQKGYSRWKEDLLLHKEKESLMKQTDFHMP